jgi:prolyl oligopeptidase
MGWSSLVGVLAVASMPSVNIVYPESPRGDAVETLHGVSVADPYRWLEDPNSQATKNWVEAQNKLTFAYLEAIPERKAIQEKLTKLINFERFGAPGKVGRYYFYTRNTGLQNQSVLYVTTNLKEEGRILLDPNTLSQDGTVALSGTSVSHDGKHLAYSISGGGSDWQEWRVRNVATGKDLPDVIKWSKFSGASWSKDGKGFYYSAYDAPKVGEKLSGVNQFQKVYYHRLGTDQKDDTLVYERKDQPEWGFAAEATEDGRYLLLSVWKGTNRESQVFVKDLRDKSLVVREVLTGFDAQYSSIGNDGSVFYFLTDKDAPNRRVVAIDISKPEAKHWRTIVPEGKEPIEMATLMGDTLFINSLKDASTRIARYGLDGKQRGEVELPGIGSAGGFGGLRSNRVTFYNFTSFTAPTTIYRYDVRSGRSTVWKQPKVAADLGRYETKQVFYTSKDGTRVPMFIVARKDVKLDGSNPTLLYGYGGFGASMTPFYSSRMLTWLEMGGVLAVACLRGGGEYGNAWHDAGRLKNKQNVFDDFIAAAEYLIAEQYTSSSKLAINGGSNGGLLVGAVLNQRPELFGAAVPEVGVMDMLRFHKFTIGWAWVSDYGSPDKEEEFKVLLAYSPLHNVRKVAYPPTLIITGDHDDRVVPAHSYKYTAAMQAAQAGPSPILIRIETSAGHGAGKPTSKVIEETADTWAFLAKSLNFRPTL